MVCVLIIWPAFLESRLFIFNDMEEKVMLRIAVQAKGRLNEQSMELLQEAGVTVSQEKRKFLMRAADFPAEIIFLRDDDIPQTVAMGAADLGIVGYNEVAEKGYEVDVLKKLGFGGCRISLAIPKNDKYEGLEYFNGKRIATSYPKVHYRCILPVYGLRMVLLQSGQPVHCTVPYGLKGLP